MANFPQESADTDEDIQPGVEAALAEAIANISGVDGQSVAGLLNQNLDTAVSTRSSHSWDPDGVIPGSGTLARVQDLGGGGTDWSTKTPQRKKGSSKDGTALSVSGSGYLFTATLSIASYNGAEVYLDLDGIRLYTLASNGNSKTETFSGLVWRFESSLEVIKNSEGAVNGTGEVFYVLD